MFIKKSKINKLYEKIDEINKVLTKNNILEISELLGNRKELLKRNLISGISKGMGIGIGVTIMTAIIIYIMQKIVKLNIPIIGEYIVDIVEIVENNRK